MTVFVFDLDQKFIKVPVTIAVLRDRCAPNVKTYLSPSQACLMRTMFGRDAVKLGRMTEVRRPKVVCLPAAQIAHKNRI